MIQAIPLINPNHTCNIAHYPETGTANAVIEVVARDKSEALLRIRLCASCAVNLAAMIEKQLEVIENRKI